MFRTIYLKFKKLKTEKHSPSILISKREYIYFGFIYKLAIYLNPNYINVKIFRKKVGRKRYVVVIGLKYYKNKVRRRVSGVAKRFLKKNKNIKCLYCRCELTNDNITTEHIVPISKGGTNVKENLAFCCSACNIDRGVKHFYIYLRKVNRYYRFKRYIFI